MLLMDRMRHALATAQRRRQGGALLFIDLDNFKTLNDTLGHDQGDVLLQQVAARLNTCVRSVDTVARLGGDEFVVMIEGLSTHPGELAMSARTVGEKILAVLATPYVLQGYHYRSTPSIGVAPFGDGRTSTVGELLKQADLAMYQAKTAGAIRCGSSTRACRRWSPPARNWRTTCVPHWRGSSSCCTTSRRSTAGAA
ncbi:GGDEF domain-containing protein [Paracidovorax citrulli]